MCNCTSGNLEFSGSLGSLAPRNEVSAIHATAASGCAALAPRGSELWVDGGHNPDGGRAVAAVLADLEERVSRPLVLVVGMLATKDAEGFLRNFSGLARRIVAVPIRQEKTLPAETLAAAARNVGLAADISGSIEEALAAIGTFELEHPPRILATGSLYFAGEVLAANGTPPT